MKRLGLNIDHVATIRNARGGTHPEPINVAKQAISLKNSKIEIFGYADRNGSASENFELSKRRNLSVEKFLTENGVNRASITTIAYGDTMPLQLDSSYESNFFDRRVSIHLRVDDNLVTSHLVEDVK